MAPYLWRRTELHGLALAFLETVPADGHAYRDGLLSMHAYASRNWQAVAKYSQVIGERAIAASAYRKAAGHFQNMPWMLFTVSHEIERQ